MVGQEMTVALVAVAAFALLSVVRGEEIDKPSPAHEVSALIKQAYPYDPAPAQKKEETKDKEPDAQVVTMERFTVVESMRSRQLEEKIESENEKTRAEKFSITKGGTIWKKCRVELGAWDASGGINFLKLSW